MSAIYSEVMILGCSDVHLICINDLSSITVCLKLLICELAFTYVYVLPVVICMYIRLSCATYLLMSDCATGNVQVPEMIVRVAPRSTAQSVLAPCRQLHYFPVHRCKKTFILKYKKR